jgi:hypothetical protein
MKQLRESAVVACPADLAQDRIIAFFESRRSTDGTTRMRLRVPMGRATPFAFSLDRLVRVEAQRKRDDENLNDVIAVAWRPEGTAMLPQFEGVLIVSEDDDPGAAILELDGKYLPPLGAAGQVFDEAIGHQIAQSTAREFLRDIKSFIERASEVRP